jgi:DNA invertase Pin-like site-specific DNA recombinase
MRTAIYTRVSTRVQENTTSLPEQERLSREKARTLGYEVSEPHVYHEVESGEDLYRPEMDKLWAAIERGEIESVVIDVLDRLSRDEGDVGAFYHHADRHGVTIELASEDRDETEKGRMMRTLTGMLARMERAEIMRRTQRGKRTRVTNGKLLPGAVPLYGYLWADPEKRSRTRYIVDPETAWVVVRIWTRIADGIAIRALCRELDADGIPTPAQVLAARGQLPKARVGDDLVERSAEEIAKMGWKPGTIGKILHHPAYVGRHSAYRYAVESVKERSGGTMRKVKRMRERPIDDAERVLFSPDICPPLIAPELAARVRAVLTLNKANSAGNNPDPLATLFRGMTYCAHCGRLMGTCKKSRATTAAGGAILRRYRCNSNITPGRPHCEAGRMTIDAGILDPAAWADIVEWLSNPKNVARLLQEWEQEQQHAQSSISSRMEAVTAQLAHLRERMSALADSISETSTREGRAVLQEKLDALGAQVEREIAKREALLRAATQEQERAQDVRDVCAWAAEVSERASEFTREMRRDTLRALGAHVDIWRSDYQHADGWPQRYRVTLTFTGFGNDAVTLPAHHPVADMKESFSLPGMYMAAHRPLRAAVRKCSRTRI